MQDQQHLDELRKEVLEHKSTIANTNCLMKNSEKKIAAAEEEVLSKVRKNKRKKERKKERKKK